MLVKQSLTENNPKTFILIIDDDIYYIVKVSKMV